MAGETLNDNTLPQDRVVSPDPHGEAALLLVESLIHALIARSLLSVADAIEVVETAAEVVEAQADDRDEAQFSSIKRLELIRAISRSLSYDLPPT